MVDLSARLVARFQAHLPPGLSLGEGFLYPDYGGGSILNIPDTICRLLGAPDIGHGPLLPEMWAPLADGVRQVLLILVDALALHRLQRWMAEGDSPLWSQLVRDGLLSALTSVVPSTTSSALTTLWTGRSPAEHAIIGYEMWLKEYGIVANTILQSPMTFQNDAGSLARAGFDPQRFLALPVLGMHLAAHGVKTHVFQHASIHGSGLSRMFSRMPSAALSTPILTYGRMCASCGKQPARPSGVTPMCIGGRLIIFRTATDRMMSARQASSAVSARLLSAFS